MSNAHRVAVSLACVDCGSRNYRTTRNPAQKRSLELKKYCSTCKKHTIHRETK